LTFSPDPRKIFEGIETDLPVIVAVSGGSDSIAMLLLAASWANINNVNLHVVTVDHGLRPEAAAEAAFVAGVSEGLNLTHITLAWDGLKPETGISHAARNARYQLLEEFARDIGAGSILVGHTANDQAETILMRNRRGGEETQGRGLSGIARLMLLPEGTRLFRPLLNLTREDLRSYLKDMNQSWIEDPSNMDESYERVRVRNSLGGDEAEIRKVCRFGEVMGRYRRHMAEQAAELLSEHLHIGQGPVYSLKHCALENVTPQVKTLVLQVMAAIAGGAEYFVSGDKFAKVLDGQFDERMTVGHAVVERRKDCFRLYREKRNIPAIIVGPGDRALWDGRLLIKNNSAMSYFCSVLSYEQIQEVEQERGRKLDVRPRAALGATPYLCGDGDDLTLPFVNGFEMPSKLDVSISVRAIEHFCPEFDFALFELLNGLRARMTNLKSRQD